MSGLNDEEIRYAEEALGYNCQIKSTAVARLYKAYPGEYQWGNYAQLGIAVVFTDTSIGSSYIKLLDVRSMEILFEQEFYENFIYSAPEPWFHVFETDDSVAGFSFADEDEASSFLSGVLACKNTKSSANSRRAPAPPSFSFDDSNVSYNAQPSKPPSTGSSFLMRSTNNRSTPIGHSSSAPNVRAPPPPPADNGYSRPPPSPGQSRPPPPPPGGNGGYNAPMSSSPSFNNYSSSPSMSSSPGYRPSPSTPLDRPNPDPKNTVFESDKDRKKREKKEEKERKEREKKEKKTKGKGGGKAMDIGKPMNVVHVSHMGWDPKEGFQIRNIPAEWKQLFKDAGVKKKDLENPETAAFIYATVQNAMATGARAPPPPPPGGRAPPPPNGGNGRAPPPPPGGNGRVPPPPPGGNGRVPPPPPGGNGRAPPPPPGSRAPPPPPGNGYDDYGYDSGSAPPPPPPPPGPGTSGSSGGGWQAQIKKGVSLKTVEQTEYEAPPPQQDNRDLLSTLQNAMASRRIELKEDEEEDEEWSDDDWEP